MMAHMMEHMGSQNPGEAEADAGQSGIPDASAATATGRQGSTSTPNVGVTMTEKKHNVSLYRALHHLNKGGLHRALGVKEGEPIPADKLAAAKNSKNEHVATNG